MLNISIVLYNPNWEQEVLPLVEELLQVKNLRKIYLLDNSEDREIHPKTEIKDPKLRYMHMPSTSGMARRIMWRCARVRTTRRTFISC